MGIYDPNETLLSESAVYLFGRVVEDLRLEDYKPSGRPARNGANRFLEQQMRKPEEGAWPNFARIYAFSFEGCIFDLRKPALFLVHGSGLEVDAPQPADIEYERLARGAGRSTWTGVGRQSGVFSMDMRVWVYDKGDFSMRLNVDSGTLDALLLDAELDDGSWGSDGRSGNARSSEGGRSGNGRSGNGRSGNGRSGNGRSGS